MARTTRRRTAPPGPEGSPRPSSRENLPRPAATAPATPVARPHAPPRRKNPFGFFKRLTPRFVADIVAELRKVTWPAFAETRYLTIVVALVALTMGIVLGLFDLAFGWLIDQLFFD